MEHVPTTDTAVGSPLMKNGLEAVAASASVSPPAASSGESVPDGPAVEMNPDAGTMGDGDEVGTSGVSAKALASRAFQNADWEYWKTENVPLLYDWFAHRNLEWPSSSARWGPVVKRYADKVVQRVLYGERTGDSDYLNTLVIAKVEVPYGDFEDRAVLGRFNCDGHGGNRGGGSMKTEKRIIHPGEVNTLRLCHQRPSVVCTHSDTSTVYVWDTDSAVHTSQNKRRKVGNGTGQEMEPTLALVGHEDTAQYALDCSRQAAHILSGGQDHLVLSWSLDDADQASGGNLSKHGVSGPVLYPSARFKGHKATVEAVAWHPAKVGECCSVGDDGLLIFWDQRQPGERPALKVEGLHHNDINCVSWNAEATELVATGDSDGVVRVIDTRATGNALHTLGPGFTKHSWATSYSHGDGEDSADEGGDEGSYMKADFDNDDASAGGDGGSRSRGMRQHGHSGSVLSLQWMPNSTSVLASGGDDCALLVWDISASGAGGSADGGDSSALVFVHPGHRHTLVDIDWNPASPGTVVTLSEPPDGGSQLQMWRVSPVVAESWPCDPEQHAIGSIAADNTQLSESKFVPLPQATVPRRPARVISNDGVGSGGITAINATIEVLTANDPDNKGLAMGALLDKIERRYPNRWKRTSVSNQIQTTSRKGVRLARNGARGQDLRILRPAEPRAENSACTAAAAAATAVARDPAAGSEMAIATRQDLHAEASEKAEST